MIKLCVNVDHVATIREARKTTEPDPLEAALLAEKAGAQGITIHLREDRRHIQDHDVRRIKAGIYTPLNLEMAAVEEMVQIAIETKPHQVSIVPEKREEITTEGGLDVRSNETYLKELGKKFTDHGILFSLFIDPDPIQIEAARKVGANSVEINTGPYSELAGSGEINIELEKIKASAQQIVSLDMSVFAGHGLNNQNVIAIASIPEIEELNIGHNIVAKSVFVGIEAAVKNMIKSINKGIKKRI
ncbi:MAG: pyridoxine 5'-phosphate synthase [Nitrospinales bacterium]